MTIIDNTLEGRDKYGHNFGSHNIILNDKEVEALKNGKAIAREINDEEYSIFISYDKDKPCGD